MSFQEFYCDASTGSNINAGDKTANGVVTSTNGGWSTVTNIFTAAAGTPFSGVSVGDYASIYIDGATLAVYIARVTTVGGGGATLTLSSTAISGTAPTTSGTTRSCTTGGAWLGPNGAVAFPLGFITGAATDVAGDSPRVNLKNGTNYAVTANLTHGTTGPVIFEGYTSSAGDGGLAVIDGGTSGTSYVLLTVNGGNCHQFFNIKFQNNGGANNTPNGVEVTGGGAHLFQGCVFSNFRGSGIKDNQNSCFSECEAYACNASNTASQGGFLANSTSTLIRLVSHDNVGSNSNGFICGANNTVFINCIADTNGGNGITHVTLGGGNRISVIGCDSYNNTGDGLKLGGAGNVVNLYIENCNLVKNGGFGINGVGSVVSGIIRKCAFGSGTQINTAGPTNNVGNVHVTGSITLNSDTTPWVDPANGDFRINSTQCKGTGRGTFTQTAASYAGAIGYPDVGAAQHQDSGGGAAGMLYIPNLEGV